MVSPARHLLKPSAAYSPATRRELAGLAAASLLILACSPAQYFGRQHDDVLYYLAAQALSEGRYRLFTTPGEPPLTFVTVGFPLLLQPVVWVFGEEAGAYQAFCALLLAVCPWLARAWLARRLDGPTATAAACVFATSPLTLDQSGTVMPEAAYVLVFCLLMLAPLVRRLERGRGLALLLLSQVRPAGLSALPAAVSGLVLERRWARAAGVAAWPLFGAFAWAAWCRSRSGAAQELFEWKATLSGAAGPAGLALDNARFYAAALGSCFLPASWSDGAAAPVAGLFLLALAAAGAARALKADRASPEAWALAGAAAMHLVWGWRYERYFLPVLPLLLWAAARALGRRALPALVALGALQLVFHAPAAVRRVSRPELSQTYAWLDERTRSHEALASLLYARDGYYANRPSLPLPRSRDSAALAAALKSRSTRWVLWQDGLELGLATAERSAVGGAVASAREQLRDDSRFELAYRNESERASIYAVR